MDSYKCCVVIRFCGLGTKEIQKVRRISRSRTDCFRGWEAIAGSVTFHPFTPASNLVLIFPDMEQEILVQTDVAVDNKEMRVITF
jgi:hypothetical protein